MNATNEKADDRKAGVGRRRHRREEWRIHTSLATKLHALIDPKEVFWTSLENKPTSWLNGLLQKKRGVRSGLPDMMFIPRAASRPTFLELKSKAGHASKAQKEIRAELVAVGCDWWMARSVAAALEALRRAGVPFKLPCSEAVHLHDWEGPFPDPALRLPQHPEVREKRRQSDRRYHDRLRRERPPPPPRAPVVRAAPPPRQAPKPPPAPKPARPRVTAEHHRAVVRECVRRFRQCQKEAKLRAMRRQLIRDREIDERDDEADPRLHDNRDDGSLFERGDGREAADAEDQDSDDDFRPYLSRRQPDGRRIVARQRAATGSNRNAAPRVRPYR